MFYLEIDGSRHSAGEEMKKDIPNINLYNLICVCIRPRAHCFERGQELSEKIPLRQTIQ